MGAAIAKCPDAGGIVKKSCCSNCKDPENRSKKKCVCGGHSAKAKKSRKKDNRKPKPTP